jgi:hypothetical protein
VLFSRKAKAAPVADNWDNIVTFSESRKINSILAPEGYTAEFQPDQWILMNISFAVQPEDLDDSWIQASEICYVPGDPIIAKLRTVIQSALKNGEPDLDRSIEIRLERQDGSNWGTCKDPKCCNNEPGNVLLIRAQDLFVGNWRSSAPNRWPVLKRAIAIRKFHSKKAGHPEGYDTLRGFRIQFYYKGEPPFNDGRLHVLDEKGEWVLFKGGAVANLA